MAAESTRAGQENTAQTLVDPESFTAYLADVPELRDSLPLLSVERIGRGQSNLTFRVTLAGGTVVLRRPPPGPLPPRAHDVLREFRVMRALATSAVPVPDVIVACSDPGGLGVPVFVMEDLPGDAIRFTLPEGLAALPHAPRAIADRTVDALAALHTTDPADVGLADLSKPSGYLVRQVQLWKGQLDYARVRPVPDLDWTSAWLEANVPIEAGRPCIVHGDYKLDNVIFAPDPPVRLLGVVDWEMAALGDPLADLGWLLAFWCEHGTPPPEVRLLPRLTERVEFPRRRELVERYARRTGRDLPQLHFYVVLALWKMAVLLEAHWACHVRGTAGSFDFGYLEGGGPILATYVRQTAEEWPGI